MFYPLVMLSAKHETSFYFHADEMFRLTPQHDKGKSAKDFTHKQK